MKTISFITLVISLICYSCSSSLSTTQTVTGHIENNAEYRGGANPPEFLLEELAVYKPSSNQTFYVRNAANYAPFTAVLYTFNTDANGNFSIDIPEGNYAVICADKYNFEQSSQATSACEYLTEPDFLLNVDLMQQNYNLQFTNKRNNCTNALPN